MYQLKGERMAEIPITSEDVRTGIQKAAARIGQALIESLIMAEIEKASMDRLLKAGVMFAQDIEDDDMEPNAEAEEMEGEEEDGN